jgi:hypothetical protein
MVKSLMLTAHSGLNPLAIPAALQPASLGLTALGESPDEDLPLGETTLTECICGTIKQGTKKLDLTIYCAR